MQHEYYSSILNYVFINLHPEIIDPPIAIKSRF